MIRLLKCEYLKTRRRYIFPTALVITAAGLCFALYGMDDYSAEQLRMGWMSQLYQLPLINTIFMSVLSVIVSSRLADIEHKGNTFKQLAVLSEKGSIYDAKLIYGLAMVLLCNLISWAVTIAAGYIAGFEGDVPIKLYLLYLLFTLVPTAVVYIFQHNMSMLFKNQAVTFFSGVIGTFCGLFSMFLPQIPALRKIFIWGYYGVLQFVGLFGWTSETRYSTAYFAVMDIDWLFFGILIIIGIMLYIIGKELFKRKEF